MEEASGGPDEINKKEVASFRIRKNSARRGSKSFFQLPNGNGEVLIAQEVSKLQHKGLKIKVFDSSSDTLKNPFVG